MDKLYLFRPVFKRTLWGGNGIMRIKGLLADTDDAVGESWELSGIEGSESVVLGGRYDGITLSRLIAMGGKELLGKKCYSYYGTHFPLLVKFIDAKRDLSVQVHPNDELAYRRHGCWGKEEMWYVVDAKPGACLLSGFSRSISPEEYEARVRDCTLQEVLLSYEVREGDVFHLPAGQVHSIGAGCMVCEIQQASDITYRIYDFGRLDKDGKPRQLHTELAREAVCLKPGNGGTHPLRRMGEMTEMLSCEHFSASVCRTDKPVHLDCSAWDSFTVLVCTSGLFTVGAEGEGLPLRAGSAMLVSAAVCGVHLNPCGVAEFIECHV